MTAATTRLSDFEIEAMFEQLMRIEGKAEIVDGRIVLMSPTGAWPSLVSKMILVSLERWSLQERHEFAVPDNCTVRVDLPNRRSVSPDVADSIGPSPKMGPFERAPVFALKVRSLGDYGPPAEQLISEKRADDFAAGTQVVWDVDLLSTEVVKSYWTASPETPNIFRPGELANAEPALPGWSVAVNDLLPDDWEPPAETASKPDAAS
jgi:Uma2 family endonuclease